MKPLEKAYWKVVLLNISVWYFFAACFVGGFVLLVEGFRAYAWQAGAVWLLFLLLTLLFSRLSFRRKGFAFRDHDVLYRHGLIATSTVVVPYNRVQHVALYEGVFSRIFGLAEIKVYTAGSAAVNIPGLRKSEAGDMKQLLMGKIKKSL